MARRLTSPKSGWPQRMLRILKLEDPIPRVFAVSLLIAGGLYLILSALVGDFIDAHVNPTAGLKLLGAAALFFLALIFEGLVQLKKEPNIEIFANESEAEDRVKEIAANERIEEAKFFEYSAASPSVNSLLKSIISSGEAQSIKLLLYHPQEIEPPGDDTRRHHHQVNRILSTLENLSNTTYQGKNDTVALRIRCYRGSASLRGRSLNNKYFVLGWYTSDNRKARRRHDNQIWGAENPVILARGNDKHGGEDLKNMFNTVFDAMWEDADALNLAVAGYYHWIDEHWLEAVSRPQDPWETESIIPVHRDSPHEQPNSTNGSRNHLEVLGRAKMANGRAQVELDDSFVKVVESTDYYVFLTSEGDSQGLYVSSKDQNRFEVREHQQGTSDLTFSYRVVANGSVARAGHS